MSGYLGPQPVPQATQHRQTVTANAGLTSITTSGYQPGYVDVYMNGVKLVDGTDYTATDGASITLASAANANDIIEIIANVPFQLVGMTFTGTTTFNGPVNMPTWTTAGRPSSPQVGTAGYNTTLGTLESWNGTSWQTGGGLVMQAVQTTSFTAVAGNSYPINTTSGAVTATLPASATAGQQLNFFDYAGTASTNNITINPNGGKINGAAANAVISTARASVSLVYVDSTQGWVDVAVGNSTYIPQSYAVDYLVVAGGGGGGGVGAAQGGGGGGGGAGGYLGSSSSVTPFLSYAITVGSGGSGGSSSGSDGRGTSGSNSSLSSIATAIGGGGGGDADRGHSGYSGGSGGGMGGGGAAGSTSYGTGTSGQGNNGGSAYLAGQPYAGGGGGGAGATGGNGGTNGGTGGAGLNWQSLGNFYAGGGGGGVNLNGGSVSGGAGGNGGGGAGGRNTSGTAGSTNTGGGGGAGGGDTANSGANGGSGIVIIRYAGSQRGTGGTVTSSGGYTYHTFTSSGSYTA
jgi:hypothetical protein